MWVPADQFNTARQFGNVGTFCNSQRICYYGGVFPNCCNTAQSCSIGPDCFGVIFYFHAHGIPSEYGGNEFRNTDIRR
jgi:hypothetical protein